MFQEFPNKKYQVIYADPPWAYRDKREKSSSGRICGGASTYYPTMTLEEIKNLPVQGLADNDCILFLWVTFPCLKEGIDVLESWGFKYKTLGFSWLKTNPKAGTPFFGIGSYTRSNCEVCLIGIKGKPKMASRAVSSAIIAPVGKHSAKPPIVRDKIVQLVGDVPRIELFARQACEGWDAWGNEELA